MEGFWLFFEGVLEEDFGLGKGTGSFCSPAVVFNPQAVFCVFFGKLAGVFGDHEGRACDFPYFGERPDLHLEQEDALFRIGVHIVVQDTEIVVFQQGLQATCCSAELGVEDIIDYCGVGERKGEKVRSSLLQGMSQSHEGGSFLGGEEQGE